MENKFNPYRPGIKSNFNTNFTSNYKAANTATNKSNNNFKTPSSSNNSFNNLKGLTYNKTNTLGGLDYQTYNDLNQKYRNQKPVQGFYSPIRVFLKMYKDNFLDFQDLFHLYYQMHQTFPQRFFNPNKFTFRKF